MRRGSLLMLLVLTLFAGVSMGQVSSGSLTGRILEENGGPAAGASVVVESIDSRSRRTSRTDNRGEYRIDELRPGEYTVSVRHPGYRTASIEHVMVLLNQKMRLSFRMSEGAEDDVVNVAARVSPLQTDEASESYLLSSEFVRDLPLQDRNIISLFTLGPGAIPRQLGGFVHDIINDLQPGRGAVALNPPVNGARSTQNVYVLDGAYNTDRNTFAIAVTPPLEAISEYRIQTSGAAAEFPEGGGGVVDVVTRSGSTQTHGSVFEFFRNEATDARGFFETPELPRGIFRQNQFGGSLGGRLVRSTYIFGTYEGLRGQFASPTQHLVPDASVRAGHFETRAAIYDPLTRDVSGQRQPFPGGVIPANRISPVARKYVDLFEPLPNRPGDPGSNYIDATPNRTDSDSGSVRLDHNWGGRDTTFVRYTINDERTLQAGAFPERPVSQMLRAQQAVIRHTRSGSSWALDATLSFTRLRVFNVPLSAFQTDVASDLGISGLPHDPFTFGLPALIVTDFDMLQDSNTLPQLQRDNTWYGAAALSKSLGSHTWKSGVQISRARIAYLQSQYVRGQFLFSGAFTQSSSGDSSTGDAFADFLLGYPVETKRNLGSTQAWLNQTTSAAYVQDDWRVTGRVSLSLGLRYAYVSPLKEQNGSLLNLDYSSLPQAPVLRRVTRGMNPDYLNFAPRAGVAVRLPRLLRRELVFRSAYGIYYSPEIAIETYDLIRNGVRNEINEPGVAAPVLTLQNGFPQTASTGLPSYWGLDQNAKTPYVQQWSAGFQYELPAHTLFEVAYAGTKGTRLGRFRRFNTPAHVETGEDLPPRAGDLQALRPFPDIGTIFQREHLANSIYHSLQIKAEKRMSGRNTFLASFVWSKSIDNADSIVPGQYESFGAQDERNLRLERGLSFFDVRRRLSAGWALAVPSPKFRRRILADWQLSGIATLQDGTPQNPVYFVSDFANSGTPNRPNVVPGQPLLAPEGQKNADHFYNPSAFADPAPYTFGNAGRNILPGPGNIVVDCGLRKRFRISEIGTAQFRAEAFNLLNHPNIGIPGPYPDFGPFFGKAFSAGSPRRLQFGLRFDF